MIRRLAAALVAAAALTTLTAPPASAYSCNAVCQTFHNWDGYGQRIPIGIRVQAYNGDVPYSRILYPGQRIDGADGFYVGVNHCVDLWTWNFYTWIYSGTYRGPQVVINDQWRAGRGLNAYRC